MAFRWQFSAKRLEQRTGIYPAHQTVLLKTTAKLLLTHRNVAGGRSCYSALQGAKVVWLGSEGTEQI